MNSKTIRYAKYPKRKKRNQNPKFLKKVVFQLTASSMILLLSIPVSKTDLPLNSYISKVLVATSDLEMAKTHFKNMCLSIDKSYPVISKNVVWNGFIDLLSEEEPVKEKEDIPDKNLDLVVQASPEQFEFPENVNMILPVQGVVTSPYGEREHPVYGQDAVHYGVDLASERGTPIVTTAPGKVVEVKVHDIYGNCVLIQHTNRIKSFYAHMDTINVKNDDIVYENTVIGTVGDTGVATGPHLHFGVRVDDEPVDPEKYIVMRHKDVF